MSCRKWRLVSNVNFVQHVELAKLWSHNDLVYAHHLTMTLVSTSHPLFQASRHNGQWQPGNTAYTCTDHNGNTVRWKFDFLTQTVCIWLSFYWKGIRVPTHDAFRKYTLRNLIWAIPRQDEVIHYKLRLRWKPVPNIFSGFYLWHCPWPKVGWHLRMLINSN